MGRTKRFLAFLLTVSMIAACIAVNVSAAEESTASAATTGNSIFSDVKDSDSYVTAVGMLNGLGVIKGYEDGTFRPLQNVTRAEFTAMLMRTLNYGSLGSTSAANLPFTDIDDNNSDINWAIPNINTAYDKGIINGYEDGTFRPNDNVAYEEAVKMIVCTLGYTNIDASGTPWYGQYIAQANKLGILAQASSLGQTETPASRACIAQLLYDSLDVNIVERDNLTKKTILSDYLGYTKNTGIVSSDGVTGLDTPDVDLNKNEVQIRAYEESTGLYETYTYKTSDDSLKKYLGYQIEFYYKNDGTVRNLALYVLKENDITEINASLIEEGSSNNTQIKYYKSSSDNALSTVNLSSENIVIYNGKLYGNSAAASRFTKDMLPKVGKISLIDSDSDNRYDIINIESYEIYYVSSKVGSDEYYIVDDLTRTGEDKKLYLDVEDGAIDTTIVNASGTKIDFSSIAVGNIICLAKSHNTAGTKVQKAVVLSNSVSGTVSGTGKDSITINGKEYKYSNGAPWMSGNSGTLAEPELDDSGVYCLDINGDVVAYKKNATTENINYGYIMGTSDPKGSFDDEKLVRILNQNGSEVMLTLNSNTKINGKAYSVSGAMDELKSSASMQNQDKDASGVSVQQLIKYTTKVSSGTTVLDKVYTAEAVSSGSDAVNDKLTFYDKVDGSVDMKYNSSSKQLSGNGTSVNVSRAVVLVVPSVRGDFDSYKKSTVSNTFRNNGTYHVEVFDISKTGYAQVIVCYGDNASSIVDAYSAVNIIAEDISKEINPDTNTTMQYIKGYSVLYTNPKAELASWVARGSGWTPQLGDIFRAGTDKDGNLKIEEKNVLYSVDGNNTFGVISPSNKSNFYSSECAILLGSVIAVDDNAISVIDEELSKDDDVDVSGKGYSFSISDFSGARVVKYDTSGKNLQVKDVSSDYEGTLRGLVPYEYEVSDPSKVLIYMYDGRVKTICILP